MKWNFHARQGQIRSILNYGIEVFKEQELSCQICANLLFFNCGNEPINIRRV